MLYKANHTIFRITYHLQSFILSRKAAESCHVSFSLQHIRHKENLHHFLLSYNGVYAKKVAIISCFVLFFPEHSKLPHEWPGTCNLDVLLQIPNSLTSLLSAYGIVDYSNSFIIFGIFLPFCFSQCFVISSSFGSSCLSQCMHFQNFANEYIHRLM